jgi:acyl-coenzyme A synthetase/AMP-(fatty) acid ligase
VRVRSDVSIVAAFVVAADGAPNDAAAIKDFAAQHLAAYKIPREIIFIERLPRTPNGKIQRKALTLPVPARETGS